jgi:dipeptidyl aminopeptidase/acylaminoacyl peptidase
MKVIPRLYLCLIILLLAACARENAAQVASPLPAATQFDTPLPTETATLTATATATATPLPTLTATPDPYAGLTIADLSARTYGGGEIKIVSTLGRYAEFTRYEVVYPSDGLSIYGFMDIPKGDGLFPVVIAVHGYVSPQGYSLIDYTTRYADALARAGFLVIHPALRGYPPSDNGPDRFRVGFAIDVLNLIAIVKQQAGTPGDLSTADAEHIGLWGHSMGGGVVIRVLTVTHDVQAAVLYGAMSADDQLNYERIYQVFSNGQDKPEELNTSAADFQRISPSNFLGQITAAVSIHHGENDQTVPPAWSQDLCSRLQALGKTAECYTYPGETHVFTGGGDQQFIQRSIDFYNQYLR